MAPFFFSTILSLTSFHLPSSLLIYIRDQGERNKEEKQAWEKVIQITAAIKKEIRKIVGTGESCVCCWSWWEAVVLWCPSPLECSGHPQVSISFMWYHPEQTFQIIVTLVKFYFLNTTEIQKSTNIFFTDLRKQFIEPNLLPWIGWNLCRNPQRMIQKWFYCVLIPKPYTSGWPRLTQ